MTATSTGLFLATFSIGKPLAGEPNVLLNLTVDTPQKQISGRGTIKMMDEAPIVLTSSVNGSYQDQAMQHVAQLEGFPILGGNFHGGGHGPVLLPNFRLNMVLDEDWQSGTGEFSYLDPKGHWTSSGPVPVRSVSNES